MRHGGRNAIVSIKGHHLLENDVGESREEQCKKAKERYRVAIESQKLYRVGKDGERQYLTSQEIDEARLNSRKDMDTVCGQAGS